MESKFVFKEKSISGIVLKDKQELKNEFAVLALEILNFGIVSKAQQLKNILGSVIPFDVSYGYDCLIDDALLNISWKLVTFLVSIAGPTLKRLLPLNIPLVEVMLNNQPNPLIFCNCVVVLNDAEVRLEKLPINLHLFNIYNLVFPPDNTNDDNAGAQSAISNQGVSA